ncbi:hypothetical protein [Candidatus Thiosymbion oneisti]|uniref:hypothetical protein n=1 Tax=Candidatus Thiosymbion oneisti TaxID=589554 RepID=UPI000B7C682A|nr:hypothetical protein [Candidatus Thiosymbion oneisti]
MSIQDLLVVGLTGMALAAVGYALYIKLRAKRYTRERYAFAFLASSTGLFGMLVTTLFAGPPWIALANLLRHWLPNIPQPAQAHLITRILVILGFVVLAWLQYRIWRHWSGGRSVHQAEAEQNKEQISVLDEGIRESRRLIRREPPLERFAGTGDREFDTIIESPTDSLAWRDQARELVELRWPSLHFDPHNDWHDREDAWVGRNQKRDCPSAILVTRTAPTKERIKRFVDYVQKLPGYRSGDNDLFVVVQEDIADTVLEVRGERIEQYSESKLLDSLVDFSDYFDEIRARVEVDKLPDSDLTLRHT